MLHIKTLKEKKDKIYIEREIPYIDTVLKKIVIDTDLLTDTCVEIFVQAILPMKQP